MLVTMKEILIKAKEGGYGVTAPNINNEDTLRAAIEAAEEMHAPMILDVGYSSNPDIVFFGRMCESLAKESNVPVCINQDHGSTFESAIWCIRAGFTSIMVDRSSKSFEENISEVAELTRIAHAVNVSVEAELGHVGEGLHYDSDRNAALTDPILAKEFVERTGIDCLAVAIGTAHGEYSGTPYLDFDLLEKIRSNVSIPLVLHGGSGTGDENLARATRNGISKVNLATDLYKSGAFRWNDNGGKSGSCINASIGYEYIKDGYKDMLKHYIKLFDQADKAWYR